MHVLWILLFLSIYYGGVRSYFFAIELILIGYHLAVLQSQVDIGADNVLPIVGATTEQSLLDAGGTVASR